MCNFKKILFIFFLLITSIINAQSSVEKKLYSQIDDLRSLFAKNKQYMIYLEYVDPSVKIDLDHNIKKMKMSNSSLKAISSRLGINSERKIKVMKTDEIVERMISNMLNPPSKKRKFIENFYYVDTYLTLSLLIAPYDNEFNISKLKISNNKAFVVFSKSNYNINAYFIFKNGRWNITTDRYFSN